MSLAPDSFTKVDLAPRARRVPESPSLFPPLPEGPLAFKTVFDLAQALATRLGQRAPVLHRAVAAYPGFDTFPAFTVHHEGPQALDNYLCTVAVQAMDAEALDAAIRTAQARALAQPTLTGRAA